jgi:hypothetical protein
VLHNQRTKAPSPHHHPHESFNDSADIPVAAILTIGALAVNCIAS